MPERPLEPLRTVCGFSSLAEAEIAGGRLRAAGLHAVVPDQLAASILGELVGGRSGVRVQVPASQLARARALLSLPPAPEPEDAAPAAPPGREVTASAAPPSTGPTCAGCGAPRRAVRGWRRLLGRSAAPCDVCGRAPGDLA